MASHLRAFVEGRLEESVDELHLASFADIERDRAPHVSDENDVLQACVAAELAENPKIPLRNSSKPVVGDGVNVYDSCKISPFFVSIKWFNPGSMGLVECPSVLTW